MVRLVSLFFLAIFVFTSTIIPLAHAQTYEKDKLAETLFQFALNLFYKGSLDQAAEEFRKIVENYPQSVYADDALFWLSKYYQTQENFEAAAKSLQQIIDKYPQADQGPAALYELGSLYSNLKNPSRDLNKARGFFLKMNALYPESPLADTSLLGAARVSFLLEDYASGIEEARRVLLRHPEDRLGAEAQWLVARGYFRLGYEMQALKECQRLRDQFPQERLAVLAKNMTTQIYRSLLKLSYEPKETVEWQLLGEKNLKVSQIKIDHQGNVVILDSKQGVWRYSPQGRAQTVIAGKENLPQGLEEPAAFAFDEDNNAYVLDAGNSMIYKFSSAGKMLGVFPVRNSQQETPRGAAALVVTRQGTIWVADAKGGKLWALDEKGKFQGVLGSAVNREDNLERPVDLALDRWGFLWVLDKGSKTLYKFDEQKKLVGKAGKGVLGKNGKEVIFDDPLKMALDDLGNVYVLDGGSVFGKGGMRITQLDSKMNLIQEILNPKSGIGELKDPTALTLDHQGRLWVWDADRKGVVIFQ